MTSLAVVLFVPTWLVNALSGAALNISSSVVSSPAIMMKSWVGDSFSQCMIAMPLLSLEVCTSMVFLPSWTTSGGSSVSGCSVSLSFGNKIYLLVLDRRYENAILVRLFCVQWMTRVAYWLPPQVSRAVESSMGQMLDLIVPTTYHWSCENCHVQRRCLRASHRAMCQFLRASVRWRWRLYFCCR